MAAPTGWSSFNLFFWYPPFPKKNDELDEGWEEIEGGPSCPKTEPKSPISPKASSSVVIDPPLEDPLYANLMRVRNEIDDLKKMLRRVINARREQPDELIKAASHFCPIFGKETIGKERSYIKFKKNLELAYSLYFLIGANHTRASFYLGSYIEARYGSIIGFDKKGDCGRDLYALFCYFKAKEVIPEASQEHERLQQKIFREQGSLYVCGFSPYESSSAKELSIEHHMQKLQLWLSALTNLSERPQVMTAREVSNIGRFLAQNEKESVLNEFLEVGSCLKKLGEDCLALAFRYGYRENEEAKFIA